MTDDPKPEQPPTESYEPPRVEDIPAKDGPAVTAAGQQPKELLVNVLG